MLCLSARLAATTQCWTKNRVPHLTRLLVHWFRWYPGALTVKFLPKPPKLTVLAATRSRSRRLQLETTCGDIQRSFRDLGLSLHIRALGAHPSRSASAPFPSHLPVFDLSQVPKSLSKGKEIYHKTYALDSGSKKQDPLERPTLSFHVLIIEPQTSWPSGSDRALFHKCEERGRNSLQFVPNHHTEALPCPWSKLPSQFPGEHL